MDVWMIQNIILTNILRWILFLPFFFYLDYFGLKLKGQGFDQLFFNFPIIIIFGLWLVKMEAAGAAAYYSRDENLCPAGLDGKLCLLCG